MGELEEAGRIALRTAVEAWERGIVDPPRRGTGDEASRAFIDAIGRTDAGTASGGKPYRRDGDREWCGDFAAYCWGAAGLSLELRSLYFASTYRLDRYAQYRAAFTGYSKREPGIMERFARLPSCDRASHALEDCDLHRRYLQLDDKTTVAQVYAFRPRAGDILIVGAGSPTYGTHICIVESFDANRRVFTTIEGNATGLQPDGQTRQGVVRQTRPLGLKVGGVGYHARRLIRPSLADLVTR